MGESRRGVGVGVVRVVGAGLSALADLALPGECAGCGVGQSGRAGLCAGCATVLERRPVPVRPSRRPARLPVVYALGGYREPLSDLIIAQKERGRLDLAKPLGSALAVVVRAALADVPDVPDGAGGPGWLVGPGGPSRSGGPKSPGSLNSADCLTGPSAPAGSAGRRILLVPIPSAKAAERRRGQDPVLRMARVAAAQLRREGTTVQVVRALRHGRAVSDQVGLSVAARAANLAGALHATPAGLRALSAGPCVAVLLDDVCTSGATLGEAARAMVCAAGFGESGGRVAAAVLAGPVR